MARDLRRELEAASADHPTAWRPEEGDSVAGRLSRWDTVETDYGERRIAVIDNDDGSGPISVWLLHTVLISEFKQQEPEVDRQDDGNHAA